MGNVALEGFGGGSRLNFKVVAGLTQPGSATENTIWVKTEKMTGWIIDANQPEELTEGMVWILTGDKSEVAFDALKKNGLQVYPLAVKQMVAGALIDLSAMSYQSGEWVEWIPVGALFWNGNQCEHITGGWVKVYDEGGYGGTLSFSNGLMTLIGNDPQYAASAGCDDLDSNVFKKYNTLSVKVATGTTGGKIQIVENLENLTPIAEMEIPKAAGTYNLPLSGISSGQVLVSAYLQTLKIEKIQMA